ncbi:DMAC1 protein, partial [Podargus strigoides]|nr:DMAC1 protein [Podargus strigoides]
FFPPRSAMAAAPGTEPKAPAAPPAPPKPLFGGCWSCRLFTGTALLMAALWIYEGPRRRMKQGFPPSMGAIAQITFAISEWGRG